MIKITLPNFPSNLPSSMEVRDFQMDAGKFARVIMELTEQPINGHYHLRAQAYEMTEDGNFVTAPLGYPSRTEKTEHTVIASALGDTIDLDDAWVRYDGSVIDPLEFTQVSSKPNQAGINYGDRVWDTTRQHAWIWKEGFADGVARAKIQDLQIVFNTSHIRSGFGFRS